MPIHEFRCKKCGEEFEELVIGSSTSVKCPSCGSDKTEQLMSCCRFSTNGSPSPVGSASSSSSSSGGCAGCSGGNCSSCGH
ncbi:FmdB family zinc ribbon protein [Desulfobaculum bizertense]|uniref:Putative regulatory protein, FmdB family n=1 Tax=Desulfobaculum bizertense DSM 18034 TaxID=1121442 RepID=A0A1T4X175_9BACT|nr:zinc ribbon domain-containing protein [Desulfobaculum bizertense]UIJ37181.1 zinc ribbon domain-containing protein [Desulfobaculum bizertense]SKA83259.1 putative regulatory protein, FmdB family [Desulfobaculum bizertense DSM 18034]